MKIGRSTRQRHAIDTVIRAARRPLSPQEILDGAQKFVPDLGMATVYRTLKLLVDEKQIQAIALPGEAPRYETAEMEHHHHFQCTSCRRVYDVPGCLGDMRRLAPLGFKVEDHDITLYGQCRDCNSPARRSSR